VRQLQELQLRRVPQCELTSSIFLQGVLGTCISHETKGVVVGGEPSIFEAGNPKINQKLMWRRNGERKLL
jgi:hypothetical protein